MTTTRPIERYGRHGVPLMLLAGLLLWASPVPGATLEVPSQYATIQEAIDAATGGDVVQVSAGTYTEQLMIEKAITIRGVDRENTIICAPATLEVAFNIAGENYRPLVCIRDIDGATIEALTIDGGGQGLGNEHFVGLAFYEAGGSVTDAGIRSFHEDPFTSTPHGTGLLGYSASGVSHTMGVTGTIVKTYQFCGIGLIGADLIAHIESSWVYGPGEENGLVPPSGVRVCDGALATIVDNDINLNYSSGAACGPDPRTQLQGAAIRLDNADAGTEIFENLITENDVAIWAAGGSQVDENFLYDNRYAGIVLQGGVHDIGGTNFQGFHQVGIWVLAEEARDYAELHDLCLNGPGGDAADDTIVGIWAHSDGMPLEVWAHNCTISQWSVGARAEGVATRLSLNESSINSNWIAGYDNSLCGAPQDAEHNWWDAADGPSPGGSGEIILGAAVDWEPILIEEYDTAVTCGLQRRGTEVAAVSPVECVSTQNPCVENIPFEITRTEAALMRGFTVTFQLSDPLDLCDELSSIHEGPYLDNVGSTQFQTHDDGGGVYTVHCVIMGEPCGATETTGTLFMIDVAKKVGSDDGEGTITVTSVELRDCDNQPISASAGAAATVTVNCEPPAAVADLATTQVKVGNDADGTTQIEVTFTAPRDPDLDLVEVYRAPFDSYPEYAGAAPGVPSYPPEAPWTLTAVSAGGQYDQPSERGFWYYVVFTTDTSGNVSAASNLSAGSLNYHLGDVSDGVTPGQGDNEVSTGDVSLLGSTYWLSDGEDGFLNYCDVGPTTDYSEDGRPTPDDLIGFEDLMIFGMNYELVGVAGEQPHAIAPAPHGAEQPQLVLVWDEPSAAGPESGRTARLRLEGNETAVKGLRAVIAWEDRTLELADVSWGELFDQQAAMIFRTHREFGGELRIDAAAIGTGLTVQGSGDVAILRFRGAEVLIDAGPQLARADLRDVQNRPLGEAPDVLAGSPVLPQSDAPAHSAETRFVGVRPNPLLQTAEIAFTLAQ